MASNPVALVADQMYFSTLGNSRRMRDDRYVLRSMISTWGAASRTIYAISGGARR